MATTAMATLTPAQRAAFSSWWNSTGSSIFFDPDDIDTIRTLAEISFAEGMASVESQGVTKYETRYGVIPPPPPPPSPPQGFVARQLERRRRERKQS